MARQLKELTPDESQAHRLGAELRGWRTMRGLSQHGLGLATHHSGALVGKIEKAQRAATLAFCRSADTVLGTGGALARLWAAATAETGAARTAEGSAWVTALRRALGTLEAPDDEAARPVVELARDVARVNEQRLQARYGDLARDVPHVIRELGRAEQATTDGRERRTVAGLTALALRAADGVAFKSGHTDLSARLIDHLRARAQASEDPLMLATAAYVGTETHFVTGDLDTAHRALVAALDHLPTGIRPGLTAARGALHMRGAVVEARAGRAATAAEHLGEAHRATVETPEGIYRGTAFGPASLQIHALAVATELHDPAGIERATRWHPPDGLPAERRSHYYIELARAQLELGRHEAALGSLRRARGIAPQHAHAHPQVRGTLKGLLRGGGTADAADLAAWAGVR